MQERRTNHRLRATFDDLFVLYSLYHLHFSTPVEEANPQLRSMLSTIKSNYPIAETTWKLAWHDAQQYRIRHKNDFQQWLRQQPEIQAEHENNCEVAYLKVA